MLQLPEQQFSNFVHKVTIPELRDLTKCEQLCEGFKEDLSFHSSLSMSSLLVSGMPDSSKFCSTNKKLQNIRIFAFLEMLPHNYIFCDRKFSQKNSATKASDYTVYYALVK